MTHPRKVQTRCPCCGQQLAKPIAIADPAIPYLHTQRQALFNLLKANPQGLTAEQIRARIFHTKRNGEPYCEKVVSVTLHHLNKKIAPWGLKVAATGGWGSVYRLVQL